jgi:hypothetical protein
MFSWADYYRRLANDAQERAARAVDPSVQATFKELAEDWRARLEQGRAKGKIRRHPTITIDYASSKREGVYGVDRFIRRHNIENYCRLLVSVTDETERQTILELLAEERQKQKDAGDRIK